ncbi:hypothetical protein AB3K25_05100 [Leuconostoc sp. MS02]|uniref:Uncharacterized protein n=1 Tax=Leuconostoc aquikimchii TaxID=3236804 RepID=A0ABV3S4V0_9LACO
MNEKAIIKSANKIVLKNKLNDEFSLIKTEPQKLKSDKFQEILTNTAIAGGTMCS